MRGKRPLFNLRSTRIRACACDYPGAETWSNFRGWDGARLFFYKMKSFSPFFSNKIPFSSKKYLGGGGGGATTQVSATVIIILWFQYLQEAIQDDLFQWIYSSKNLSIKSTFLKKITNKTIVF